jgi:bifunctional UDP-N-acetylglucosamine pyrophosphorylase/glucosamine-1-phosphate N-acetyltransferase
LNNREKSSIAVYCSIFYCSVFGFSHYQSRCRMSELHAIILAAGEGTRMKSQVPKVLHELAGNTLIGWVLQTVKSAGVKAPVVVLGHKGEDVAKVLPAGVRSAWQRRRLGTGDAVTSAKSLLAKARGEVLVLCGDAPLICPRTLRRLVQQHRRTGAAATVLTARVGDPTGYGRVVRTADGRWVERIVEQREASAGEQRIDEINSGAYCFSLNRLWPALGRVGNRNRKGEYYLTDAVEVMHQDGLKVGAFCAPDAEEVLGVNSRRELAQAGAVLNRRTLDKLLGQGVTVVDPARTWVEPTVKVGADSVLWPETYLLGNTVIGARCTIGPGAYVVAARVGDDARIRYSMLEHCSLGRRVHVGPFSHVRRGSRIAEDVHIGNFAEINRSRLDVKVKMGHMSYLGDATVGRGANIGAGTITANYDGVKKHPTVIGPGAFIGSGTVIVAPSRVGAGALTGAGAVLKRGTVIPAGTVAVGVPARVIKKRSQA